MWAKTAEIWIWCARKIVQVKKQSMYRLKTSFSVCLNFVERQSLLESLKTLPFCLQYDIYREMEYFRVAKFSRFHLKNMRINFRGF